MICKPVGNLVGGSLVGIHALVGDSTRTSKRLLQRLHSFDCNRRGDAIDRKLARNKVCDEYNRGSEFFEFEGNSEHKNIIRAKFPRINFASIALMAFNSVPSMCI